MPIATDLPNDAQVVPAKTGVSKTASATAFSACRGFHANFSGTATIQFKDASAAVDVEVVSGVTYPYSITHFTTGTGTLVVLY